MSAVHVRTLYIIALCVWCLSLGCAGLQPLERTPNALTGQKNTQRGDYAIIWSRDLSPDAAVMQSVGTERAKPTFSLNGDVLYVGTRKGGLFAMGASNGVQLWRQSLSGGVIGQPVVTKSLVLVGTGEGKLVALDRLTGSLRWSKTLKGLAVRQPVVVNQTVIARDGTNTLYAFSLETGQWLWQQAREKPAKFSMAGEGPLFAVSGNLYVGFSDGAVSCYALHNDGRIQWTQQLSVDSQGFNDVDAGFAFVRQYLAAASPSTGIALLDTRNGKVTARIPRPNVLTLHKLDGHLLATTTSGDVLRLDPDRNQTIWRSPFSRDDGAPNDLAVMGGTIFVTFPRGGMVALDATNGYPIFGVDIGRGVTGIATHDASRRVAFLTTRGQIVVLGPDSNQGDPNPTPLRVLTGSTSRL